MSTDPSGVDPCPRCGGTSGAKVITGTNPRPQLYLDRLTATVVLRQVIALEEQAPGLSDDQLWARLAGLARVARGAAVTVSRGTDKTPTGRWLSDAPDSAPDGQSGPDPASLMTPAGSRSNAVPGASRYPTTSRCADLAGRVNRG